MRQMADEIVTTKHRSQKSRRGIYILPNLFTTASLFAGFYAIVQATKGNFDNAAIAIFISMIMDGLDGRVARMTNTVSDFGKEYDSLADVIAFGLAPAMVMYEWTLSALGKPGWLTAFVYVAATALRLARFNVHDSDDKRYFQGLPCPGAAAIAAAWIWSMDSFAINGAAIGGVSVVVTMLLAIAMVSNLPYYSFKEFDLKNRVPFVALVAVVLVFVLISFDPPRVLLTLLTVYFFSGIVMWFINQKHKPASSILYDESDMDDDGDDADQIEENPKSDSVTDHSQTPIDPRRLN